MRRYLVLLNIVLILLLFTLPSPALSLPPLDKIYVQIKVEEDGNATVLFHIKGEQPGSFWIMMPKYEKVSGKIIEGEYRWVSNESTGYYFYYRSTIEVKPSSKGFYEIYIYYNFPYASLIAGDSGWFMSPQLLVEPPVKLVVNVTILNLKKVTELNINPTERTENSFLFTLSERSYEEPKGRIVIEYDLKQPIEDRVFNGKIDGMEVTIVYPEIYSKFAEKVFNVIEKSYPILIDTFGVKPEKLEFKFFLPKESMGGISTLGFVLGEDINIGGKGPIRLNLGLIRYAEGYLETTIIHEYTHLALGIVGIEANDQLRWFHEGMAQYISIEVAEKIGLDTSDYRKDLVEASNRVFDLYGGNLGFVTDWPDNRLEESYAYAASYYIIHYLAEKYGGLGYIRKISDVVREEGSVKTNSKLIEVLSKAAGTDLRGLFEGWGFILHEVSTTGNNTYILYVLIATIFALIIVATLYVVFRRVPREMEERYLVCPFCKAYIPSGASYCPYCGRIVSIDIEDMVPSDKE